MKKTQSNSDSHNARWDEVRAFCPVVERWLSLVTVLLHSERGNPRHAVSATDAGGVLMDEILGASDEAPAETSPAPVPATDHSGILPVEALAANADERIRLQSLFEQYKTCREVLTPLQWTATCLRFRDGLSETEIAFRLGKSRSAVHGLLKRARTRKEEFRSRLREEAFLMARKHLNP